MALAVCWILLCVVLLIYMDFRAENALPCATFLLLLFVYLMACFQMLNILQKVFWVIDIGIIIYIVLKRRTLHEIYLKISPYRFKNCVITILILSLIFFVFIYSYSVFRVLGDGEFQYYAISVKQMFLTDSLGNGDTVVYKGYASYLPLISLYYYIVLKIFGRWQENLIYISNIFLCLLCCLPLLHIKNKGCIKEYIIRIIIFTLFPFLVAESLFNRITPEPIEGMIFAYSLYSILDSDAKIRGGGGYYLKVIIALSVLILTKSPAILMYAVCVIFLLMIHNRKADEKKYISLAIIIPLVMLGIWKVYCKVYQMHAYLHDGSKNNLLNVFTKNYLIEKRQVILAYIKEFFLSPLHTGKWGITSAAAVIICIVFLWLIKKKKMCNYEIYKKWIIVYFIGLGFYCIGHLYLYLFVFFEEEAAGMSAFDRYLGGYLLAGIFLVVYGLLQSFKIKMGFFLAACIIAFTNWNAINKYLIPKQYLVTYEDAIRYREIVEQKVPKEISLGCEPGDKIVVFYNHDMFFLIKQNIRYYVVPADTEFILIEKREEIKEHLKPGEYTKYIILDMNDTGEEIERAFVGNA